MATQATPERPRILMFGYLPPPYFGPSVTYQALMRSEFSRRFDVTFVDITVVRNVAELERFRPGKLLPMAAFMLRTAWLLATRRFDFACGPVSINRNAFLKDVALLSLARRFGVPTVLYAHGNNIPDFHDRASPRLRRMLERMCRQAAGGIVLGESLRFNFERWLPTERIFVVPTGIEPLHALPSATKDPGIVTVVYLGNLLRDKGVFVLLKAAAEIASQRSDIRFVFAGDWFRDGDEPEAIEFVRQHSFEKIVHFAGPVVGEAKWRLLAGADMLVFPTFYHNETMGLVLLEAMQAGVPVVATRRASIPEIVKDGVSGLLVAEQDSQDLVDKILRLANDPALREQMGRAGRRRFAEYYTHEQYGRRMIGVFESLAATRGSSG